MLFLVIATLALPSRGQLCPDFYDHVCPQALPAIKAVVERAVARQPRMGGSLLRLHFHDCFVNGCDGSVLLDDAPGFTGEKTATPNLNSLKGFKVIDEIKNAVNEACHGNVVSCADILAIAARDSVAALGGPPYMVLLGRRDSRTASLNDANNDLPPPVFNFSQLLSNFGSHGLDLKDLVVLSGGHTIGQARCTNFKDRLYNETNIDQGFAGALRNYCPRSGGDNNLAPLDATPASFDTAYFNGLLQGRGLLHSDQQLFKGDHGASDGLVSFYSGNPYAFWADFAVSMVKMGNIKPLTGNQGEIRMNCRKVN
uniref:Peroxidase n=2 Tax=Elaeis guineensis var. tenera TaxID=51953 RepID=A0A6I9S654_ELAGV|nr:peroxidase P7-like [Elaeis guineensis]